MTTETTTNLPPCPLPDCTGGEHHYHDVDAYAIEEGHDCACKARFGYRCYSQHQPGTRWEPIERDEIRAGMRIRATVAWGGRVTTHTGVAHTAKDGNWLTEGNLLLTGWSDSVPYEVDPATVPDPDVELIEAVAETLYQASWPTDLWDGLSVEAYREVARAALTAIRAHDEAVPGDE